MMDYDSPSKMKFVLKHDNRKGISSRFVVHVCCFLFAVCWLRCLVLTASSIIDDWTTIRNLVIVRDKVALNARAFVPSIIVALCFILTVVTLCFTQLL